MRYLEETKGLLNAVVENWVGIGGVFLSFILLVVAVSA